MRSLLQLFYVVFGLLSIGGGVMGFVKAKSRASLIAGGVCGVALIAASFLIPAHPIVGLTVGIVTSVALAGKFIPDLIHKPAIVPGGVMAFFSAASVVLTLLAWYKK
ncbi:MAG: hypothetical protein QOD99_1428 [Chthoniobacter sp.]|jgi:uncharacterized membrane protein (UPF0136 family)|nr:hypothetical protein [Chthoniobacter sp.]